MTTYRLSCGHEFTAEEATVDLVLRDRLICPDCFDTGAPEYRRYVVAVRP